MCDDQRYGPPQDEPPDWAVMADSKLTVPDPGDDYIQVNGSWSFEIIPDRVWGIGKSDYMVGEWIGRFWLMDRDRRMITDTHPSGFESLDMAIGYAMGRGLI